MEEEPLSDEAFWDFFELGQRTGPDIRAAREAERQEYVEALQRIMKATEVPGEVPDQ